ncbi:MAG: LPS export ABC transporter permease LptF [Noviherbaspirillum sp.]
MIFQRALRRELLSTAGAVFTTLFSITITVMLIRILGQAAGGKIASQDVVALLGFSALNYLPIILILTGFVSVLLVLTRTYQDSEMVVWFASGLSLTAWVRPVLSFAVPLILVVGVLSLAVTPWANRKSSEFRDRFEQREDVSKVSPGRFQESASADRVFFVEGVAEDVSNVKNVFINSVRDGKSSVIVAREGSTEIDSKGDKFLVLRNGRRYDGTPSEPEFQLMEFERYGVLINSQAQGVAATNSARALPLGRLIADPTSRNRGELLWRMALPLMGLLLMLLAIPLGFVNPRGGRSANLLLALLVFIVYSNMVSVLQAAVVQDRLALKIGWWPLHLFAGLIVAFLFSWRILMNSRHHPLAYWSAAKRAVFHRRRA